MPFNHHNFVIVCWHSGASPLQWLPITTPNKGTGTMRKVFAGILLAFTLPAMADIAADLNNGMSPAAALEKAKAECGASCDEAQEAKLVEEMLAAGIAPEVVAQAAKANGIKPATVAAAMTNAGLSEQAIASASPEVAKAAVTQTKAPKTTVVLTPTTNPTPTDVPPPSANAGQPPVGSPT